MPEAPVRTTRITEDPVLLEILWSRLVAVMDEVDAAVVRTSFSTVLAEGRDFACILLDREGRSLAQATYSTTAFTVTLPRTAKHLLARFSTASLSDGDMLATNDPWMGSGHLPDFSFISPIVIHDEVVGFMGTVAHLSDVGGRIGYFNGKDVFEEGFRLPPSRLFEKHSPNPVLFELLTANLRAPDLVLGDMRAIAAAHALGAARISELLEEHSLPDLEALGTEILSRSSKAMATALTRLGAGVYEATVTCDGYGEPTTLHTTITIDDGCAVIDFSGSSEQTSRAAINAVASVTYADVVYAMKCALIPDVRNNEGLFWPVSVEAPEGSIVNALPPAPVQARSMTTMHIHEAIFSALATALPNTIQAGSGAAWPIALSGFMPDGSRYATHFFVHGGMGATSASDGLATTAFPYNAAAGSVEIYENSAPILVERKRLRVDSGGAGQFRGGLGQEIVIRSVSPMPITVWIRPDKVKHPAIGLAGGSPGLPGVWKIGNVSPDLPTAYELTPGDSVVLELPGGGGFGDPRARAPLAIERDVQLGYVSLESAERDYGVTMPRGMRASPGGRLEADAAKTRARTSAS